MADYRGYVTQAGHNFEAVAKTFGYPVKIGVIEIGDGTLPDEQSPIAQTALVNKIREFPAKVWQDADNPGQWIAECAIPADDSVAGQGYFIREMGCKLVEQGAGVLYAYRRVSNDFKPLITTGEAKSFIYRMKFIPSSDAVVHATVDPTIVWVTQSDLDGRLAAHADDPNAHPSTAAVVQAQTVASHGDYRFMMAGQLNLAAAAADNSRVAVIVDHQVDLAAGDCLIAVDDNTAIVTPSGSDTAVRIIEKGREFVFVKIDNQWRVS